MKGPETCFIDTNIFIRAYAKEDEKTFAECALLFKNIKLGKLKAIISSLVLAEINWVLTKTYSFSKSEVFRILRGIGNLRNLRVIDQTDLRQALSLYQEKNVKFIDTMIATHELVQRGVKVVSYDQDFDKLPVKRIAPARLLKSLRKKRS